MSPEILALLTGAVMFAALQFTKKTGLPSEVLIISACAIAGIGYTVFRSFLPPELQASVLAFVSMAFSTSWALYQLIWKPTAKIVAPASPDAGV